MLLGLLLEPLIELLLELLLRPLRPSSHSMTPLATRPLRLMPILAHPDDESLGCGGVIARYAAEGVAVQLVTATRGERGRHGEGARPSDREVGVRRELELRAAAEIHRRRSGGSRRISDGPSPMWS
jgi:LmbE family N-acetylglucosaminyl deacetylase